ncbi:MAG: GGDEF domain-containing protein [Eubacteriales bacterium]|nr:GGDEF domain-containing protein [Eubacteriales bacterium]
MEKKAKRNGFRRVDKQVSVFTAIVAVVSCVLVSSMYFYVTYRDMMHGLEDRVRSIHDYIVNNVEEDVFFQIDTPEDMDTALYRQAHAAFRRAKDLTGVMYLYSGKRNAEGELIYVVDCIDTQAEDFRAPGDPIEEEIVPEMERALEGREVMPRHIKNTDWGKIFISYLPIRMGDEVVGVIGVEFEAGHQYNTYQFLLCASPVVALVICAVCAFVANRLFRRISNPFYKDMFNTDYLTNLKSRNAFEIDLENLSARKKHEGIGFYVIDLNNLKKVNDTLGHEAGDVYLQIAARSFRDVAGENATVYRVGGDEFVILSVGDAHGRMMQLAKDMQEQFDRSKPEWEIPLSFSIGLALYDAGLDKDLSDTYHRADERMYLKKREFHRTEL